jgi:hypothetical protein
VAGLPAQNPSGVGLQVGGEWVYRQLSEGVRAFGPMPGLALIRYLYSWVFLPGQSVFLPE